MKQQVVKRAKLVGPAIASLKGFLGADVRGDTQAQRQFRYWRV
jgi:hypothetical protein